MWDRGTILLFTPLYWKIFGFKPNRSIVPAFVWRNYVKPRSTMVGIPSDTIEKRRSMTKNAIYDNKASKQSLHRSGRALRFPGAGGSRNF